MASSRRDDRVLRWLLEPDQPAMRYLASRDLLSPRPSASDLRGLREPITERGWAADILARQHERTWWERDDTCYWPRTTGTYWCLGVLADLGLTREDDRVANAVEHMLRIHLAPDGGFSPFGPPEPSHFCSTGIMVRTLLRLGYLDDARTWGGIEWLLAEQLDEGGWDCHSPPVSTLDAWEALAAFAAIPAPRRTRRIQESIHRGVEFYLSRGLLHEGSHYPRWSELHYPWHYWYDVLVGLDFLTTLGYGADRRAREALDLLRSKRRPDGTWAVEGVNGRLRIESQGRPSKMITFLALRALRRSGAATRSSPARRAERSSRRASGRGSPSGSTR